MDEERKNLNNMGAGIEPLLEGGNTLKTGVILIDSRRRTMDPQKIELEKLTYLDEPSLDLVRVDEIARLNKVKVYVSRESGKLFLSRDDTVRAELFKKLGLKHVYADVEACEDDSEALKRAEIGRFKNTGTIIIGFKEQNILEKVRKSIEICGVAETAKLMIRDGFSESYAYRLIRLAGDEELYSRIIRGELTIHSALRALSWKKSGLPIEAFIEREVEKKGLAEPESIKEQAPLSKTEFKKAYKKIVGEVVYELGEFPGTIRCEMENALWGLRNIIKSREEMKSHLIEAVNQLRRRKSMIQKKAIRIWARHVRSGEKISFMEAEEEAMKELGIPPPTEASRNLGGRGGDGEAWV